MVAGDAARKHKLERETVLQNENMIKSATKSTLRQIHSKHQGEVEDSGIQWGSMLKALAANAITRISSRHNMQQRLPPEAICPAVEAELILALERGLLGHSAQVARGKQKGKVRSRGELGVESGMRVEGGETLGARETRESGDAAGARACGGRASCSSRAAEASEVVDAADAGEKR